MAVAPLVDGGEGAVDHGRAEDGDGGENGRRSSAIGAFAPSSRKRAKRSRMDPDRTVTAWVYKSMK